MAMKSSGSESSVTSEGMGDLRAMLREVGAEIRDRASSFERHSLVVERSSASSSQDTE